MDKPSRDPATDTSEALQPVRGAALLAGAALGGGTVAWGLKRRLG